MGIIKIVFLDGETDRCEVSYDQLPQAVIKRDPVDDRGVKRMELSIIGFIIAAAGSEKE